MATRIYVVPREGTGVPFVDPYRPKYLLGVDGLSLVSGAVHSMYYGRAAVFLASADVTPAEHTALAANADVLAVPAVLDNAIGGALATVVAKLEPLGFPCDWVTAATTWRQLVRTCARMIALAQRLHLRGPLLPPGITLDSTIGDLTQGQRDFLRDAIESFGGTTNGLTGAMPMRLALQYLAAQAPLAPQLGAVAL